MRKKALKINDFEKYQKRRMKIFKNIDSKSTKCICIFVCKYTCRQKSKKKAYYKKNSRTNDIFSHKKAKIKIENFT